MKRPTWNQYFFEILEAVAKRATCDRGKSACVIVKDNRILVTGYVGSPPGFPHCDDVGHLFKKVTHEDGSISDHCCLHGDTKIKLLNGTYKKIKYIAKEGKAVWLYSVDRKTGKIVPALAINPIRTGIRKDLVKVILDNNAYFKCTADHKILMRNGKYKQAGKLKENDSLMPMYFSYDNGYERIFNTIKNTEGFKNWKNRYKGRTRCIYTHHLVHDFINGKPKKGYDRHHKNDNRKDNEPENLTCLLKGDHSKISCAANIELKREVGRKNMNTLWADKKWRKKQLKLSKEKGRKTALLTNSDPKAIKARTKGRILSGLSYLQNKCKNKINLNNYESLRKKYKTKRKDGIPIPQLDTIFRYFKSLKYTLKLAKTYNHKVRQVLKSQKKYEVYDIEVPKYRNFAIKTGKDSCIFVHNCQTIHAEVNAICQAAKQGISIDGSTLYVTMTPCRACAMMIINCGIKEVKCLRKYHQGQESEEMFKNANINLTFEEEHIQTY